MGDTVIPHRKKGFMQEHLQDKFLNKIRKDKKQIARLNTKINKTKGETNA